MEVSVEKLCRHLLVAVFGLAAGYGVLRRNLEISAYKPMLA